MYTREGVCGRTSHERSTSYGGVCGGQPETNNEITRSKHDDFICSGRLIRAYPGQEHSSLLSQTLAVVKVAGRWPRQRGAVPRCYPSSASHGLFWRGEVQKAVLLSVAHLENSFPYQLDTPTCYPIQNSAAKRSRH